jgi:gamma-glutamyl AIG2-like cyclotransferase
MKTTLFAALALAAVSAHASDGGCGEPLDTERTQYIVGYGSLMQDESRMRTSPKAGPPHPVEVEGYRRGWFSRAASAGPGSTFLGVQSEARRHINAVVYQVSPAEVDATDKRESLYCRVAVAMSDIRALERGWAPEREAQAWIYLSLPATVAAPDGRYPIVQSYVDLFVSGCLEQEQRAGLSGFTQECLATTDGWSEHWVNDRLYPRRPFVYQPRALQIDALLSQQLPRYFSRIRIEPGT